MRLLVIIFMLAFCLGFGQAKQKGIVEFSTIAELKATPLQPQESDFAVVMSADGGIKQLYNYEPTLVADEIHSFALDNYAGAWAEVPNRNTLYKQLSGRFEIDNNYRWASWSDPFYGPSLHDWDLDSTPQADGTPPVDWDGMGLLFPKGATLIRLFVKVRANSNDVDVIQVFARAHDVDLLANNPIDSNAEIGAVSLTPLPISIDLSAGAANANDVRAFEIPLNYTFINDGDLHVFMKAADGSLSSNRQLRSTIYIEYLEP